METLGERVRDFSKTGKTGAHSVEAGGRKRQTTAVQLWQWQRGRGEGDRKGKINIILETRRDSLAVPTACSRLRLEFSQPRLQKYRGFGGGRGRPSSRFEPHAKPAGHVQNVFLGEAYRVHPVRSRKPNACTHIHERGENVPGFRCKLVFLFRVTLIFRARPCPGPRPNLAARRLSVRSRVRT